MPPRLILCFEYTAHLYQSRRLDHTLIEAAINKYLALDLVADSQVATVMFGQHSARSEAHFQRLEAGLSGRFALFNPAVDPFDEPVQLYSQAELAAQFNIGQQAAAAPLAGPQSAQSQQHQQQQQQFIKLLKGTCSFGKLMEELAGLLAKSNGQQQYDDVGADLVVITSGLFVEDEPKLEEIIASSPFRREYNRLQLIIYPSTMLLDTKSRDGYIVLDALESELVVRSRLAKLLLIQRLTGAHIHLVKEQLDANGDVKLAPTLVQFYQIFDKISRGHSWDQTHSMQLIDFKQVDSRPVEDLEPPGGAHPSPAALANGSLATATAANRLVYQFELDPSVQNELFVGLVDPRRPQVGRGSKSGRRFSLRSLQLRSPGGQLLFTETATSAAHAPNGSATGHWQPPATPDVLEDHQHQQHHQQADLSPAFFPYRAQLSWAAFHLKPSHLAAAAATSSPANGGGLWTLSAISEEPLQTVGLAMARVNPAGDTLTATCWLQTYHRHPDDTTGGPLEAVKVFAQVHQGPGAALSALDGRLAARMEVQDQLGNIVQNVQMLDDGLGAPDITRADSIWSQYVRRAHRPGFYRVLVELRSLAEEGTNHATTWPTSSASPTQTSGKPAATATTAGAGQDNACCGSYIPQPASPPTPAVRHLSRQVYCGTFYVDERNRLAEQRPPRVNNLTVVGVDQEGRRLTLRWYEPQTQWLEAIPAGAPHHQQQQHQQQQGNDLVAATMDQDLAADELGGAHGAQRRASRSASSNRPRHVAAARQVDGGDDDDDDMAIDGVETSAGDEVSFQAQQQQARGLIVQQVGRELATDQQQQQHQATRTTTTTTTSSTMLGGRYEIKLFTDRDIIKRAFDSKHHEIGFKFSDWNVEGQLPLGSNGSEPLGAGGASGGGLLREVTLRLPASREGVYYVAMRVYNGLGLASQVSNIVQFYVRNNLTLEEAELIYGPAAATVDAEGNVYDKNGELIQRGPTNGAAGGGLDYSSSASPTANYGTLIGGSLDGLSLLILVGLLALILSIVCISLVGCLAGSARRSKLLHAAKSGGQQGHHHHKNNHSHTKGHSSSTSRAPSKSGNHILAGSGSSMVSSTLSGSSSSSASSSSAGPASEVASSAGGSQYGANSHEADLGKLALVEELNYNQLREHQLQQQQHQQSQMMSIQQQQQQVHQLMPPVTQHTLVNGYAYATLNSNTRRLPPAAANCYAAGPNAGQTVGDLNQDGLGAEQFDQQQQQQQMEQSSWPADLLMSHYDRVKQARELNEAPPVLRLAEYPAVGLPEVTTTTRTAGSGDYEAASRGQLPSYLLATSRRGGGGGGQSANTSYFNQQLQQQLSSVLRSKRSAASNNLAAGPTPANDDQPAIGGGSSPALEGLTADYEQQQQQHQLDNSNIYVSQQANYYSQAPPPPAQYPLVYETNGLASQLVEPTIYSQTTNLVQQQQQQQHSPAGGGGVGVGVEPEQQYYANNQWHQQHQHQQASYGHSAATYGCADYDKTTRQSAISEV